MDLWGSIAHEVVEGVLLHKIDESISSKVEVNEKVREKKTTENKRKHYRKIFLPRIFFLFFTEFLPVLDALAIFY